MPRRLALLASLTAVLALTACQPIHPDNRPLGIPHVDNGRLPGHLLREAAPGCWVYHEAAPSLRLLLAHAARDGVRLAATSCYRDYDGQVRARESACARGECHMAAVPGHSNHGWGKAVDFRDQHGTLIFGGLGYRWLEHHAWQYGWNHPGVMKPGGPVPEPWHWEWVGDGGRMFPRHYFGQGTVSPLPGHNPRGSLDAASRGDGMIRVSGWAIDPDTSASIEVHVHVNGVPRVAARADHPRPDIATAFPAWAMSPHGYYVELPARPGDRDVCLWGINVGPGGHGVLGCTSV
jgi:hypothetical protein